MGGVFLLFQAGAFGATTLTVSATVPQAQGISLGISSIVGTGSSAVWTALPAGTSALNFNTMVLNTGTSNGTAFSFWAPTNYFAIDIGVTGGVGTPTVNITYTEGTNPNGTSNGLGTKTGMAFDYVSTAAGSDTLSAFGRKTLTSLTGTAGQMPIADIPSGYWERAYVGVCTGNTNAANGQVDPTGCKTFGNTDAAGTYTGTLTFTATAL